MNLEWVIWKERKMKRDHQILHFPFVYWRHSKKTKSANEHISNSFANGGFIGCVCVDIAFKSIRCKYADTANLTSIAWNFSTDEHTESYLCLSSNLQTFYMIVVVVAVRIWWDSLVWMNGAKLYDYCSSLDVDFASAKVSSQHWFLARNTINALIIFQHLLAY